MSTCTNIMNKTVQKNWDEVLQQYTIPPVEVTLSTSSQPLTSSRPFRKPLILFSTSFSLICLSLVATKQLDQPLLQLLPELPKQTTLVSSPPLTHTDTAIPRPRYEIITKPLELPKLAPTRYSIDRKTVKLSTWVDNWETHIVPGSSKYEEFMRDVIGADLLNKLNNNKEISTQIQHIPAKSILRIQRVKKVIKQLIIYQPKSNKSYLISLQHNEYKGQSVAKLIEPHQQRMLISIDHSFRYDANRRKLPPQIIQQLFQIFKRDIHLMHDLHKGDQVTVVYETYYHQTSDIASGEVLAAEVIQNKRSHRAIRYVSKSGEIGYYNPQGYDLKLAFMRHPIKHYKRISSRFGVRMHPIKKRLIKHLGTDYAASTGAPVIATATGIVQHVGRKGGYGKAVIIRHQGGYQTLYGHLSRFAKHLHAGKKIYQGDIIAYVGSTGRSTGPHLHYEFRINGKPYNSLTVKLPHSRSLPDNEIQIFRHYSILMNRQLNILQRLAKSKIKIDDNTGG